MTGKRPYRGMRGDFLVMLDYDGVWVAHGGAMTEDGARKLRRKLPQWPNTKVQIVANHPGAPKELRTT